MIALLTLECHQEGNWIKALQTSLVGLSEVRLVTVESILDDPVIGLFDVRLLKDVSVLVNRVSDAAEPHLSKACLAIMQQAQLHGLKIVNGPQAYSLCSNKWCHHVLFDAAGLQCPRTVRVRTPVTDRQRIADLMDSHFDAATQDFLLKPNSGGFGSGIQKFSRSNYATMALPEYSDGIGLIQSHIQPSDGKIYRIWFLSGKVQCAVTRNVAGDSESELTSGCASSCSVRSNSSTLPFQTYRIPAPVIIDLEQRLLPLIPDAHAGSVEYLIDSAGQRLYFDLNLLSTLPDLKYVDDSAGVWDSGYCPWEELALAIMKFK